MYNPHLRTISHALVLIAIILGLIAIALWIRIGGTADTQAQAQTTGRYAAASGEGVPDSGKQRLTMIEQLEQLNKQMADLQKGFREGTFTIQTTEGKPKAGQ